MEHPKSSDDATIQDLYKALQEAPEAATPTLQAPKPILEVPSDFKDILDVTQDFYIRDGRIIVPESLEQNDIVLFLKTQGVRPGNFPISHEQLFELYQKCSKIKLDYKIFTKHARKLLKTDKKYYYINTEGVDLYTKIIKEFVAIKRQKIVRNKPQIEHFKKFLSHVSANPGTIPFSYNMMEYLYIKYCEDRAVSSVLVSQKTLAAYLKLFLPHQLTVNGKWQFLLSDSVYKFHSKELMDQIARVKDDPQNDKDKKKRRQIPSS